MKVKKRSGQVVDANYHKITLRISKLASMEPKLSGHVDCAKVSMKTIAGLYDGITTLEIDELASEIAATMSVNHPDYGKLASRIVISNLHKSTPNTFLQAVEKLHGNYNEAMQQEAPLVSDEILRLAHNYQDQINALIAECEHDYQYSYFGMKTLMRSYLLKTFDGTIVERPQYLLMRVALGIWKDNFEEVKKTFLLIREGYYTHATPTLFNAGTNTPQLSSCFLLATESDSIDGFFNTIHDSANISKWAGGLGIHIHNARANGSYIKGTGGKSSGIVPMLKTYNEIARWIDQGGKRKGSFAMYLEPWHADVFDFLDLKKNHGKEERRARDLYYGLWIPDLFMKRVEEDGMWTLMCPFECPGLSDVYGQEFEDLYTKYEQQGKGKRQVKAQQLWFKILESQIETGTPYMLYKDAANKKSNQNNLGTIKSSNLCTEIIEYSDETETAVCNLISLALPKFIVDGVFDHDKLFQVTYQATKSLNKVIDVNYYPTEKTKKSNLRHRPLGIGVQGLSDVFMMLKYAFESEEAQKLNDDIFETIYNAALWSSLHLAMEDGKYETFDGSLASKGILQYDLWDQTEQVESKGRYDWKGLKEEIVKWGLRNSLLLAPMPTASTAQILGNNEAFEPITSNLYTRRVLSGEFIVINEHLVNDLMKIDKWNETTINHLKINNGSVQLLDIPQQLKDVYKTAWEISMKRVIDLSADRGKYICQSQSLNIFMENANFGKLTSMHFYGWKKGLKTGMYYLRTKAATDAIKFTASKQEEEAISCSLSDPDNCEACGS